MPRCLRTGVVLDDDLFFEEEVEEEQLFLDDGIFTVEFYEGLSLVG